jgi:transposase
MKQRPEASCAELARQYESLYGVKFGGNAATAALRQAGIRIKDAARQEIKARPDRLARLCATMENPTRDKLATAYKRQYGVTLKRDRVCRALRMAGIFLKEPRVRPDPDEVLQLPRRLKKLAEQHPDLTYDQLGQKYQEEFGRRLAPSTVATYLNRLAIYRFRVPDADEIARRPRRLAALVKRYLSNRRCKAQLGGDGVEWSAPF